MNVPLGQEPASQRASGAVDGDIASQVSQHDRWWLLGKAVLLSTCIATAVVVLYYLTPSAFNPAWLGALYGYAFIASLVISVGGGLALTIRKRNPWWLLTLPWGVALLLILGILARAMGLAAMH
jgi:hypothetical protein